MSRYVDRAFPIGAAGGIVVNTSVPCNSSNYYPYGGRTVKYIVMHYTGNDKDTAKANARYFNGGSRSASAHYFVDNDSIYQSVKLQDSAWAVGGTKVYKHPDCRNLNSVSIEMCCSGGKVISAQTEENAAQLCARLCGYLNIGAGEVDTYVLRHWDVWDKLCPLNWTGNNNARWNGFKARVKQILKGESEEELTVTQYEELKALQERVSKLESESGAQEMIYDYIDENMPAWARPTIQKLVGDHILNGDEKGRLGLTNDLLRILVVLDRVGVLG